MIQENITPLPAGTAVTWQARFMLFTQKFCLAIGMLQQKAEFVKSGGVLSVLNCPLLLPTAARTSCSQSTVVDSGLGLLLLICAKVQGVVRSVCCIFVQG